MMLKSGQGFRLCKWKYANEQTEKGERDYDCRNEDRFQGGTRGHLGENPQQ